MIKVCIADGEESGGPAVLMGGDKQYFGLILMRDCFGDMEIKKKWITGRCHVV